MKLRDLADSLAKKTCTPEVGRLRFFAAIVLTPIVLCVAAICSINGEWQIGLKLFGAGAAWGFVGWFYSGYARQTTRVHEEYARPHKGRLDWRGHLLDPIDEPNQSPEPTPTAVLTSNDSLHAHRLSLGERGSSLTVRQRSAH
jgi:hypothetical protein